MLRCWDLRCWDVVGWRPDDSLAFTRGHVLAWDALMHDDEWMIKMVESGPIPSCQVISIPIPISGIYGHSSVPATRYAASVRSASGFPSTMFSTFSSETWESSETWLIISQSHQPVYMSGHLIRKGALPCTSMMVYGMMWSRLSYKTTAGMSPDSSEKASHYLLHGPMATDGGWRMEGGLFGCHCQVLTRENDLMEMGLDDDWWFDLLYREQIISYVLCIMYYVWCMIFDQVMRWDEMSHRSHGNHRSHTRMLQNKRGNRDREPESKRAREQEPVTSYCSTRVKEANVM